MALRHDRQQDPVLFIGNVVAIVCSIIGAPVTAAIIFCFFEIIDYYDSNLGNIRNFKRVIKRIIILTRPIIATYRYCTCR